MNSISFKNLKLFKNKGPKLQKTKKKAPPPKKEDRLSFLPKLIQNPFLFLFIFVALIAYFISYLPSKSLPLLQEGEIASSDVVAPVDLTIVDKETTEKRKREAAQAVSPVYDLDMSVFQNAEKNIRELFARGREQFEGSLTAKKIENFKKDISDSYNLKIPTQAVKNLARIKFSPVIEENLINLLGKTLEQGIILSKNLLIRGEEEKGMILSMAPAREKHARITEILDVEEAKQQLSREIEDLDLSPTEKSTLTALSHLFISPNLTYNNVKTDSREREARDKVETVFYTIKKGKMIVRKGDEVDQEAIKQIQIINQNLRAKPSWVTSFSGTFLLFGLLFLTLWYYLKSLLKFKQAIKNFIMMGTVLLLSLLFYKLSLFLAETFSESSSFFLLNNLEPYRYVFPFQFGVFLFSFLTGSTVALIYAVLNSLLVGYLFKANFYLMVFCLIGGFAAIYGTKYYGKQKRSSPFRAGIFVVAPINMFVVITIHLIKEKMGSLELLSSEIVMGIMGGLLSATLAFIFLPVFEHVFGFLTQSKLLELTNSDLPIFRKMAMEAPGSYHHSLMVASLSGKAAEEIKLNSMLVKAGSLYHDIGKLKRPEYFIENRTRNPDMHRDLKPSMSTLVIVNHVKEGLERAKKLKLPKKIKEIIAQHHGNSLVRYFYHKAREKYDPEMHKIGEESYRYPGPKPQSKEAALIMLADSVEAASRSLKTPTEANLKKVIIDIFNNYVQDGQLDECDFSFKELRTIASSFLSSLNSIYQKRLDYPGFEFEKKTNKKAGKPKNSDDANNKSTKKVLDQHQKI
ncbi:MAG: HD family phosphohydrolase [Candidatus Aminicenantes bacterium]